MTLYFHIFLFFSRCRQFQAAFFFFYPVFRGSLYSNRTQQWKEKADSLADKVRTPIDISAEKSKLKYEKSETVVDNSIIESSQYRRNIDKLGESKEISREIYQQAKSILQHRTGTEYEDLVFIDSTTGKSMTRADYDVKKQVLPSKNMMKMVKKVEPYTVIAIHNHPTNSLPSMDDINSALKKKYKYGIIACHNGNIYKYTVLGNYNEIIVDSIIDKVNILVYNKDKLQADIYTINLKKALNQLRDNNIELEVLL